MQDTYIRTYMYMRKQLSLSSNARHAAIAMLPSNAV